LARGRRRTRFSRDWSSDVCSSDLHTVFFYQLLSMYFLVLVLFRYNKGFRYYAFILLSALFLFLSLFTKQDGGAFAFCITFFILRSEERRVGKACRSSSLVCH